MSRWEGIIVHHTASTDTEGPDIQAYREFHVRQRRWRDLGYHFVCELVGDEWEVLAGRPLNMSGAHCPGKNGSHIGFAFAGDFSSSPPPVEQLAVGCRFLAGLVECLDIPLGAIEPHRNHRQTVCPGVLDVEALRELVERYRAT